MKKELCQFDLKNVSNIKKKFPRVQWKKFKCRREVDIDASAKRTARLQTLAQDNSSMVCPFHYIIWCYVKSEDSDMFG